MNTHYRNRTSVKWACRPAGRYASFMAILAAAIIGQPSPPCYASVTDATLEAITARLATEPVDALPEADRLFERLCELQADTAAWSAFRVRLTALSALRERITTQLEQNMHRVVGRTILDLMESDSATPQTQQAPQTTSFVSAEQLYRVYAPHFRYPIDTSGLSPVEKLFLQNYYNSHVRAMIEEIMRKGLVQAGGTEDQKIEYFLLLLPLLHSPDDFDVELLKSLPPWMLTNDRIKRLIDFCLLRVGRFDAAEAIALRLRGEQVTDMARYKFYVDTASQCQAAGRPTPAVECLRRAIACLAPDDPRVAQLHFEICDIWHEAKNLALAADEAGAIARKFAGTEHAGRARYLRITYLTAAGEHRLALQEIDAAVDEPVCKPHLDELLYYRWKSLRQLGKGQEANRALRNFFDAFPDHPHGAEMYFAVGVDCLATQRYEDAQQIFELLIERYPDSSWTRRAEPLLERIAALGSG